MLRAAMSAFLVTAGGQIAYAGSFQVSTCGVVPGFGNNSWVPLNSDAINLETSNRCGTADVTGQSGSTSGLAASDVLGLSSGAVAGATAGWRFTAPAGDAIGSITLDRDLFLLLRPGWRTEFAAPSGSSLPG